MIPSLPLSAATRPTQMKNDSQEQFGVGIRVALLLTVLGLVAGAVVAGAMRQQHDWWLAILVYGLMVAPFLTIPLSVAHTFIMRFLPLRGPIVSSAIGVALGLLATLIIRDRDFAKPFAIYGAVYGLIVWLRRVTPENPGLVPDKRTDLDEAPPKAPFF